jgi:hypothetical protein
VRRSLLAGAALALALAAPAAAELRPVPGSSVGDGVPLKAYASITPSVHLFGDAVTARVAVVADTKWVQPRRLRVSASFEPYEPVRTPQVLRSGSGRFLQLTWVWTLRCLRAACVPSKPPSDTFHVYAFHSAHIDYLAADGSRAYGITAAFPRVEVLSQVSPGVVAFLQRHNALDWQFRLAPIAAPRYRVSPSLVYWLALALAAVSATGGLLVAGRWVWAFAPARTARRGDDTLQRKALERVADELEATGVDLSAAARALAWSPERPEEDDVAAISERARTTPPPEGAGL